MKKWLNIGKKKNKIIKCILNIWSLLTYICSRFFTLNFHLNLYWTYMFVYLHFSFHFYAAFIKEFKNVKHNETQTYSGPYTYNGALEEFWTFFLVFFFLINLLSLITPTLRKKVSPSPTFWLQTHEENWHTCNSWSYVTIIVNRIE